MDLRRRYYKFLSLYHGCYISPQFRPEGAIIRDLQRIRNEMLKNGYSVELMTECNNLIILFKAFYT